MQTKTDPSGQGPTDTLKKYQLKAEYHTLFENLAKGEALSQGDAFHATSGPRSYPADGTQARADTETLRKLVECGFVDEIDTGIRYKPR